MQGIPQFMWPWGSPIWECLTPALADVCPWEVPGLVWAGGSRVVAAGAQPWCPGQGQDFCFAPSSLLYSVYKTLRHIKHITRPGMIAAGTGTWTAVAVANFKHLFLVLLGMVYPRCVYRYSLLFFIVFYLLNFGVRFYFLLQFQSHLIF